jgi:hypothetical protein
VIEEIRAAIRRAADEFALNGNEGMVMTMAAAVVALNEVHGELVSMNAHRIHTANNNDRLRERIHTLEAALGRLASDANFSVEGHDGECGCCVCEARAALRERPEDESSSAYEYLTRLLSAIAPRVSPMKGLLNVCTQIDNAIAGLRDENQKLRADVENLRDALNSIGS